MSTITIHTDDPTTVGDIVSYLLKLDTVRWHVEHDNTSKPSAPAESLVDEIMAYEADKAAAKLAARKARNLDRYDWRVANYDRLISLDCGYCGAVAGKPCQKTDGSPYAAPTVHGPRVHDLQAHDEPVPVTNLPDWMNRPVVLDEV